MDVEPDDGPERMKVFEEDTRLAANPILSAAPASALANAAAAAHAQPPAAYADLWSWFERLDIDAQHSILQNLASRAETPLLVVSATQLRYPARQVDFLAELPVELALHVVSMLGSDIVTLCRCSCVSRTWRRLANDVLIWQRLCVLRGWVAPLERLSLATLRGNLAVARAAHEREQLQHLDRQLLYAQEHHMHRGNSVTSTSATAAAGSATANAAASAAGSDLMSVVSSPAAPMRSTVEQAYEEAWWGTTTRSGMEHQPLRAAQRALAELDWKDRFRRCYVEERRLLHNWLAGVHRHHRVATVHADEITCVSCVDSRLLTGSADGTLKVWDLDRNVCVGTLVGHRDGLTAVSFNDRWIVTASMDHTMRVYDATTGDMARVLGGHRKEVQSVVLCDALVVSGSWDNTMRLWNVNTGECLHVLAGHTGSVYCVCVDTERQRIISGSGDRTIRIWSLGTGECLRVIEQAHRDTIACMALVQGSERPAMLVTGSFDNSLALWNLATGARVHALVGHAGEVWCVQVSSSHTHVLSGSMDATMRMWDVQTGLCVQSFYVGAAVVAMHVDHAKAILGCDDASLSIYDFSIVID